ncbi:hypothetical protein CXF83_21520 [Shewanella sp. Choline-02u-19]|nr:hypothetical protein CXF83_21520 [Shewanella sp. Choline-02u-19]
MVTSTPVRSTSTVTNNDEGVTAGDDGYTVLEDGSVALNLLTGNDVTAPDGRPHNYYHQSINGGGDPHRSSRNIAGC